MKKVFFSFAIATMMASLVACGGKTGQNPEGQDSTAVETETEAAEEEVAAQTAESASLTVGLSDYWEIKSQSNDYIRLAPQGEFFPSIGIQERPKNIDNAQAVAEYMAAEGGGNWPWSAQEDLTTGSITWKVLNRLPNEGHDKAEWFFVTDMPQGGVCQVQSTFGTGEMDDSVLEVLKNIKFK
ncbi:MAG: hypothetical protein IJV33_02110 [Bacteroidaceae bacterium]|nr:hypothetical protein [Bacteroidaceae bacterium]